MAGSRRREGRAAEPEAVASPGLSTQRFVERIIDDIGPGQGSTALLGAEPRRVGLVALFSDVIMLLAPLAFENLDICSTSPLL